MIDPRHAVKLVQHTESGRVFVMKKLKIYDRKVFAYLKDHPAAGIPHIEERVEDARTLYVIEEYVSGENLRSRLDRSGPLQEEEAIQIVEQLCAILLPLHQQNPPIVHRDIKPGNIIQRWDGSIVLVDFNSAKESNAEQSRDTVLIGTVGYAAPEQFGFSVSQPTTDIYAIGVLLNELLTCRLPTEKLYEGGLQRMIRNCLEMDPQNRYQTIRSLRNALQAYRLSSGRKQVPESAWRFMPPGFRSKSPKKMACALLGYAGLIWVCCTLQSSGEDAREEIVVRITSLVTFLADIFWCGNYLNVWSQMPLSRSSNKVLRLIGVALWTVTLTFMCFLVGSMFA